MEVKTSRRGKMVVTVVKGRVDSPSAREFEAGLAAALAEAGNYMVLDCAALEYISSAGLRGLLLTMKKADALGGKFIMCRLSASIREVLDISGFSRFMEIFERVEDADAAVAGLGTE